MNDFVYPTPSQSAGKAVYEDHVEQAALGWMSDLGWSVMHGSYFAPDAPSGRADYREVVLTSRLRQALSTLNPGVASEALEQALRIVVADASQDPLENNRRFLRILRDGVDVEVREGSGARTIKVRVVDLAEPERNDFLAVNQFTIVGQDERRPDVLAFVNGLPLGVIELKDPTNHQATLRSAYNQLQTYRERIPALFRFNAVMVISDGLDAKIGALTSGMDRYGPWRTIDGDELAEGLDLDVLIRGVFDKSRFLELAALAQTYEVKDGAAKAKKVAGYHQFHAVRKALAATIAASRPTGDRKAGVVWHSTGSGKSFTMALYASRLERAPDLGNPTVVMVTDRNDLDDQLFDTFCAHPDLFATTPIAVEDRDELRAALGRAAGGIVFTTMQKFGLVAGETSFPELSARRNIIVVADEAHRTQYGFKSRVTVRGETASLTSGGFAQHIRDALPNATFIGFTGTPVETADRNTRTVFGDQIDTYDIAQSVEDGATVPIYYTARLAQLRLHEEAKAALDEGADEVLEAEETTQAEKHKGRWSRLEALVGAQDRIDLIAADIVEHFEQRREGMGGGKAMIVAMSRRICVALFDAVTALRPDWAGNEDGAGMLKVIMTGNAGDPEGYRPHIRNKSRLRKLADRFKDPTSGFDLVIVRDMWLTGFDAPSLHTLYVDKPMRGHGLIQAISRVNRVFGEKPGGLVVDYLGIGAELKAALTTFSARDQEKAGVDQDAAERLLLAEHEAISAMLTDVDWRGFFTEAAAGKLKILRNCIDYVLSVEDGRRRYLDMAARLVTAFALSAGTQTAARLRDDVALFTAIRANLIKHTGGRKDAAEIDHDLNQLLSRAVIADGILDVFRVAGMERADISLLSDEFLADVQKMEQKNLAIEALRKLLAGEVKGRERKNAAEARRFSERLEASMARYHNRAVDSLQVIQELIDLAKDMRDAVSRGKAFGLSDEELAFYDALAENKSAVDVLGNDQLRVLAQEIARRIRASVTIDWTRKESVRADMRRQVKQLLRRFGYPPDLEPHAIEMVLEQARLSADEMV
ncbi:type I restriction endonuclease subunit R [Brevundimonas bacteroides]|uniref:type I restriction endonuclease subunit R n=1 Tax=Brevundimonas bacteroides TaxID=74311 RepID=UPI0004980FFA|nr:type I restriction endonuclease subunit R [Brevundimonas bacteroides]